MQTRLLTEPKPDFAKEQDFTRIGLLLLATDLTTEYDFCRFFHAPNIRLHTTRLAYANPVTPDNLRAMTPRLAEAAALLPPDTPLAAVYFACASGSVVIGDAAIERSVQQGSPLQQKPRIVTPVTAAQQALRALKARRISLLTPYTPETSLPVAQHFAKGGFEVQQLVCLGLQDDRDMARVSPDFLIQAARQAMHPESDALFVSCTALRAFEVVQQLEATLQRPVVTSNQAAAWRILQYCNLAPPPEHYGRLMRTPLSAPANPSHHRSL